MDGDHLLDELLDSPSEGGARPPRVRYRHEALIDLMLTHPEMDQNDYARILGYTPSWLSTIICSDAFQAKLAERREEIVDPQIRASLQEQFRGILHRSMEIIRQKLDGPAASVDGGFALRTAEVSSRALGYGARQPDAPKSGDLHIHLESLGDNLVSVLRKKKAEVLEGELVSGPQRTIESQG